MTIGILLAGVLALWGIVTFNRMIRLRRMADGAWADIDVQLKRRHDLVPRLVEVVKGHAGYERSTLEAVVEARTRAVHAEGPSARARAEQPLAGSVGRLLAVAEAYPELRAMESFRDLQQSLTDVEDHLQQARRYYNAVVRDYNTLIGQLPSNLVATAGGFSAREYFGLDGEAERAAPRVDTGAGP